MQKSKTEQNLKTTKQVKSEQSSTASREDSLRQDSDVSLSSICSGLKKLPQTIKNQPVSHSLKQAFREHQKIAEDFIVQETNELESLGWSLNIRASGTEELVRITIWGDDPRKISQKATEIASSLLELENQLDKFDA